MRLGRTGNSSAVAGATAAWIELSYRNRTLDGQDTRTALSPGEGTELGPLGGVEERWLGRCASRSLASLPAIKRWRPRSRAQPARSHGHRLRVAEGFRMKRGSRLLRVASAAARSPSLSWLVSLMRRYLSMARRSDALDGVCCVPAVRIITWDPKRLSIAFD